MHLHQEKRRCPLVHICQFLHMSFCVHAFDVGGVCIVEFRSNGLIEVCSVAVYDRLFR
jgi:hypothetical protein